MALYRDKRTTLSSKMTILFCNHSFIKKYMLLHTHFPYTIYFPTYIYGYVRKWIKKYGQFFSIIFFFHMNNNLQSLYSISSIQLAYSVSFILFLFEIFLWGYFWSPYICDILKLWIGQSSFSSKVYFPIYICIYM